MEIKDLSIERLNDLLIIKELEEGTRKDDSSFSINFRLRIFFSRNNIDEERGLYSFRYIYTKDLLKNIIVEKQRELNLKNLLDEN